MIKLYDFASSPNCQRVKIVLAEKDLPYEIVPIDLRAKEQKTPDFLKLNPNGKVPVLTDDDLVLYESCIINEYLEEKYPNPPLLPKDPAKKAKARILIDYGMAHLDGPYQKLRMELMKEPAERNQQVADSASSGTAIVAGSGSSCRIAISFAFQRKYATADRTEARIASAMARPTTTNRGSSLVANCSSSTPPASSDSAVRIQARKVRSFASENR